VIEKFNAVSKRVGASIFIAGNKNYPEYPAVVWDENEADPIFPAVTK
jgi:hypothetical protein